MTASHGLFSFPFFSGTRNEKALPGKGNFTPTKPAMAQGPLFNNFNKMKRKRSDSSPVSPCLGPPIPKKRVETLSYVQIPTLDVHRTVLPKQGIQIRDIDMVNDLEATPSQRSNVGLESAAGTIQAHAELSRRKSMDSSTHEQSENATHAGRIPKTRPLHQAIEAQFGLEILLKHKELRLIDQEFAKCQAALEQLRRCQLIPYPAMSSDFEAMQSVSKGTGSVCNDRAPQAPPWGVVNGPYSRHYERWLIPDSAFAENVPEYVQTPSYGGKYIPDRATRGSKSDAGTFGSISRSQRGSNGARLKALPHGYPEPKEEKGPMIVKRGSDGKMVKLVCLDCRRSNFNSAQGFINHCRIAHSRQFLSHDAAIEASGEELDMDAVGIVGEMNHGSQATPSSVLVHPLIRASAHMARAPTEPSTTIFSKRKRSQANTPDTGQQSTTMSIPPKMSTPPEPTVAVPAAQGDPAPFKASPQTLHLSALFAKMGRCGDLEEMVNQASARPDIDPSPTSDEEDYDEEEGAMDDAAGIAGAPQSRSTRGVIRGGDIPARRSKSPKSSEQTSVRQAFSNVAQKPSYLSHINIHQAFRQPYHSDEARQYHNTPMQDSNTPFDLSPNTVEAHTAPSLVSDDGELENTHSESESPSSAEADEEDHYIHAEVMDHDDMDLGEGTSADQHLGLGGKPPRPTTGMRPSAMRPPMVPYDEEPEPRHVSFASPGRRERRGSRPKDGK